MSGYSLLYIIPTPFLEGVKEWLQVSELGPECHISANRYLHLPRPEYEVQFKLVWADRFHLRTIKVTDGTTVNLGSVYSTTEQ